MKRFVLAIIISLFILSGNSQTSWEKYPGNPIMTPGDPGTFNSGGYAFVTVLKNNDTLDMWFTASDQQVQRIGLAKSTNGYDFEFIESVPFFEPSGAGYFDRQGVFNPQILKINDTTWYMWYSGLDYTNFNAAVGLAVSIDGLNWQRLSTDPVLDRGSAGSFDQIVAYAGTVMLDGGIYKMWYTGMNASYVYKIGYATSPDGKIWTKYPDNPILNFFSANPKVMKTATGYQMWYNESVDGNMYIFYAVSEDGITWQSMDAPVISPWPGTFDDEGVSAPSVVFDETTGLYQLWYTAWSGSNSSYSVGYATDSTLVKTHQKNINDINLSVFPDPVIDKSFITYKVTGLSPVALVIYDLTGRRILNPLNETKASGTYTLEINCSAWPGGLYICNLLANGQALTTKFIVLK